MEIVKFGSIVILLVVYFFTVATVSCERTVSRSGRVKRVSDQRLAELETLVGLTKMSGKLVTVPLALGKVDPKFIGRKRRSQQSLLLDRILASIERDMADAAAMRPEDVLLSSSGELSNVSEDRDERRPNDQSNREEGRTFYYDEGGRAFLDNRLR